MLSLAERKVILRALMTARLELENAKFEVAQAQDGRYTGEDIQQLDRALNDVGSVLWRFNQRERTY